MAKELAKTQPAELAVRPDWLEAGDTTGADAKDIEFARLTFAQGLHAQMTPGDSAYIEDLKMFDMFNPITNQVYGKGPLLFVPIQHDVRRIEFRPRTEGGGIIRMNVPPGDPTLEWDRSVEPNLPPTSTTFYEWVIFLLFDSGESDRPFNFEPVILSIADKNKFNRKTWKKLKALIGTPHPKLGILPIYAKTFTLESSSEKNDKGTFAVPVVRQAGLLQDGNVGRIAREFAKGLQGKNIVTDREPGADDFDPNVIEAESVQPAADM